MTVHGQRGRQSENDICDELRFRMGGSVFSAVKVICMFFLFLVLYSVGTSVKNTF